MELYTWQDACPCLTRCMLVERMPIMAMVPCIAVSRTALLPNYAGDPNKGLSCAGFGGAGSGCKG